MTLTVHRNRQNLLCIFCADFWGESAELCGMDLNMVK